MEFLDLMDKLSEEQRNNAVLVATAAANAGVDPTLAVAIAYQGSGLNLKPQKGSRGGVGIMQIAPSMGRAIGFDEKALADPKKNIEAGIEYLRRALIATENDPQLAAVYYSGGPSAFEALKSGQEPDPGVIEYVRTLESFGTFNNRPVAQPVASGDDELVDAPPPEMPSAESTADPADRLLLGGVGAALGTGATGIDALMANREAALVRRAGLEERARLTEQRLEREAQAAREAQTRAATTRPPAAAPVGPLSALSTPDQATRIQQGTIGDLGTTGRARSTGFNTETAQLSAGQKQAYATAEALKNAGLVAESGPEFFSRQPGMTSTPSGVLFPRGEPMTRAVPRALQDPFFTMPPISLATPSQPPEPPRQSGLSQVTEKFKSMMRPVAGMAERALRVVAPPLAGVSAGLDTAEIMHEMSKPADQRDPRKIGLKGASLATGALSMIPGRHQMFTIPASVGASGTYEYLYNPEFRNYVRKKLGLSPDQPAAPTGALP
jgi:hypothetical protein